MPSAVCLVNNLSTLNVQDVGPEATFTISLADTTGAARWTVLCVGTDDRLNADVINSSLSINSLTKSATCLSPAGGSMVFESVVNDGRDINGRVDSNLTYRFKVSVPINGFRTVAVDEGNEHSRTHGWSPAFNDLIYAVSDITGAINGGGSSDRNAAFVVMALTASLDNERVLTAGPGLTLVDGGGGGSVTLSTDDNFVAHTSGSTFQKLSGSLQRTSTGASYLTGLGAVSIISQSNGQVFVSASQELNGVVVSGPPSASGKVLTSTGTGSASWQDGATQGLFSDGFTITDTTYETVETALSVTVITSSKAEVQTDGSTLTTIYTASIVPNSITSIAAKVQGVATDLQQGAFFDFTSLYLMSGSTATNIGTTAEAVQGTVSAKSSWDVEASVSGDKITVQVLGASDTTIVWSGLFKISNTAVNSPTAPQAAVTSSVTGTGIYATGVKYRGINRAGAEYGDDWYGWNGQTYFRWPHTNGGGGATGSTNNWATELDYYKTKGFNCIRLPISWERLQHTLLGALDATYQAALEACVLQATEAGFTVVVDLHNYDRYYTGAFNASGIQVGSGVQRTLGDGTLSSAALQDVWTRLANLFKSNPLVVFELMNESHDLDSYYTSTSYFAHVNAVIAAIRATSATNLILVPNTRGSDVDHWIEYSPLGGPLDSVAALDVTDSGNNYAFAVHAYRNGMPSRYSNYADLIDDVTQWAVSNSKKLWLTEFGYSTTDITSFQTEMSGVMAHMNTYSTVWEGWMPWNLDSEDGLYAVTSGQSANLYASDNDKTFVFDPFLVADTVTSGPSGSAAPPPSQIDELQFHIKADTGVTMTDWYVNTIADQSSASNNVTCNDSNNVVQRLDNQFKSSTKPSIYFPSWNNQSSASLGSTTVFPNHFSAFIVFKTTATDSGSTYSGNPPMTMMGRTTLQTSSFGLSGGNFEYYHLTGTSMSSWSKAFTSGLTLNDGFVHTVAISHNGSGLCKIYADNSEAYSSNLPYHTSSFNRLGVGFNSLDPARDLNIAEIKLFNTALSASQVNDLHGQALTDWS